MHAVISFGLLRQTQIQIQKFKTTECPSLPAMTALSLVLPLHPSDKPKKANTKEHT